MNKKILCIFFIILLISTTIVSTTVVLPSSNPNSSNQSMSLKFHTIEADADVFIVEPAVGFDDRNWEMWGHLQVGNAYGEWASRKYTLLYFDISELPANAVISSVELSLTRDDPSVPPLNPMELKVRRCTSPWGETTVTWGIQPTTWAATPEIVNDDPEQYLWDVTEIAQYWWSNPSENYGFMIMPNNTADPYTVIFNDRLFGSNPVRRPLIRITYEGDDIPPWTPDVCLPDDIDPTVTIDISPWDHNPGHKVITAHGSDNQGLRLVYLSVDGPSGSFSNNWYTSDLCGETPRDISISESLSYGPYNIEALVRDFNHNEYSKIMTFDIGSGTSPTVSISFSSTSPTRVWPEDGQTIEVIITAEDLNEGIRRLDVGVENGYGSTTWPYFNDYWTYSEPYPPNVEERFTFTNLNVPHHIINPLSRAYSEIQIKASAEDSEYLTSGIVTIPVQVDRPYQWDYGLPFENPTNVHLSWRTMYDTFGLSECNWGRDNQYHHWWANKLFNGIFGIPGVKDLGIHGVCYGMCSYSLVYSAHKTNLPDDYTFDGEEGVMNPLAADPFFNARNCVRRNIERFHASQYSVSIGQSALQQYLDILLLGEDNWYSDFLNDIIPEIQRDVENGRQGFLSMTNSRDPLVFEGHVVVPWHIEQIDTDNWRIYVYDPNRNLTSLFDEFDDIIDGNNYFDYDNFELYPYIDISRSVMSFNFKGGGIWNGFIAYIPYSQALKNDYNMMHSWHLLELLFSLIF